MNRITIQLPFPSMQLNPNKRLHWSKLARAKKQYRQVCYHLTKALKLPAIPTEGDLTVSMTFYPPDRRRRDRDNLVASMKSGLDGVATALKVDDCRFDPRPYLSQETGNYVLIEIEWEN